MNKYYWTKIYQVSKSVGFVKSGQEYCEMTTFKSQNYLHAAWTLIYYNKLIMVEEIMPFLAREVKTGILFPILSFRQDNSTEIRYKSYPFIPIHTFVGSIKDKQSITYTKVVQTTQELEKYDQMYPDVNILNKDLLNIITTGKSNIQAKLNKEKEQLEYEKQQLKDQKQAKKNERLKVRKLQHQFKQGRKNIK